MQNKRFEYELKYFDEEDGFLHVKGHIYAKDQPEAESILVRFYDINFNNGFILALEEKAEITEKGIYEHGESSVGVVL